MLFTSMAQLIVLAILFFGGLMFGLGLHPGGKKWRKRFEDESKNYAQFRRDADVKLRDANKRIAELERDHAALSEREARTRKALSDAEFKLAERDHQARQTVASETPIVAEPAPTAGIAVPIAATAAKPAFFAPTPAPSPAVATPVEPVEQKREIEDAEFTPIDDRAEPVTAPAPEPAPKKNWFSMGGTPDLGRIRGIDAPLKTKLFGLGVTRFEDITELSDVDEIALEQRLSLPAGYITREQWRDQAALLRAGQDKEHAERFGE